MVDRTAADPVQTLDDRATIIRERDSSYVERSTAPQILRAVAPSVYSLPDRTSALSVPRKASPWSLCCAPHPPVSLQSARRWSVVAAPWLYP